MKIGRSYIFAAIYFVLFLVSFGSGAKGQSQSDVLNFSALGQGMWAPGTSIQSIDRTFDIFNLNQSSQGVQSLDSSLLGVQVTADYSYNGSFGLQLEVGVSSGSVNVDYGIDVNAVFPKVVQPGGTFTIDTANWSTRSGSLQTIGPEARLSLNQSLQFSAALQNGNLGVGRHDVVSFDHISFDIDAKNTLFSISPGSTPNFIPVGSYGEINASSPNPLPTISSELLTNPTSPTTFKILSSSAHDANPFLQMGLDLDAVAATVLGLPPETFSGTIQLLSGSDRGVFISYKLVEVIALLKLSNAQKFTFTPTSVDVTMSSSSGQVLNGQLGEAFTFNAPEQSGQLDIHATFTLNGQLRNQSGFIIDGSVLAEAGEFRFEGDGYGPDFFGYGLLQPGWDINLGQLLFNSDTLLSYEQQFFELLPLYWIDKTFDFSQFVPQDVQYRVDVVPEPSILALCGLGSIGMLIALRRKKRA